MIRARSIRPVGSVRDREIANRRCRCSASVGSAITRPIPRAPSYHISPKMGNQAQHMIFRDLYTSLPSLTDPLLVRSGTDTKTSVIGAINMLGLAKRLKARVFQASTSEVYGDPNLHPQPESYCGNVNPIGPRACYDEGKRCAETLFFDYFRQHQLKIRVARVFNTYGPRMHPNDGRVVSNFIVQALRAAPITLYGDGAQTRAFCYVDDLIGGFVRLMAAPDTVTGPINLGNPTETSIAELAGLVIELTGSRSKIVRLPLPIDDPVQRCPDITEAEKILGWQPRTSLVESRHHVFASRAALRGREAASRPPPVRAHPGLRNPGLF
jgi:dTDP-4-dehydrorhamnose reductase